MPAIPREAPPVAGDTTEKDRSWAQATHLVGVLSAMPGVGVLALIACAILWRMGHEGSSFLDDHGREATNFQISILIYSIIATVIIVPLPPIGGLAWVAIAALTLIGCVRGAMAAGRSEYYRYPASLRLLHDAQSPSQAPY